MSDETTDFVNELGDTYLVLHRENYIRQSIDVRPRLERAAQSANSALVARLLSDADWRPQIVGTYLVICLRSNEFDEHLCRILHRTHMIARSVCLAFSILGTPSAPPHLFDFLRSPDARDHLDDCVAAVEALGILAPDAALTMWAESPPQFADYSCEAYAHSALLFHAAIRYWR